MNLKCLNNISDTAALIDYLNQIKYSSRSNTTTFALLDIDNFSYFNFKYGFEQGDILLEKVCKKIKQNILHTEFTGRLGSDEFLIIVEFTYISNNIFIDLLNIFKKELKITASIGLLNLKLIPQPETLIISLHSAVQEAKSNGKNQICIVE